jgi:hypothetical protein
MASNVPIVGDGGHGGETHDRGACPFEDKEDDMMCLD